MVAMIRDTIARMTAPPAIASETILDRWQRERLALLTTETPDLLRRARYELSVETRAELRLAEIAVCDPSAPSEHTTHAFRLLADPAADLAPVSDDEERQLWRLTRSDEPTIHVEQADPDPQRLERHMRPIRLPTQTWASAILVCLDRTRTKRAEAAEQAAEHARQVPAFNAAVARCRQALVEAGTWPRLVAGDPVSKQWMDGAGFLPWAYLHGGRQWSPGIIRSHLLSELDAAKARHESSI